MGKKIRGVKFTKHDINKNTGKDISHTISKIQANERRYTILLVLFFMFVFFIIGFISLRIRTASFFDYSNNFNGAYLSLSSRTVLLDDSDKINDQIGLSREGINIVLSNITNDDINYKLKLVEDNYIKKKCGCFNDNFNMYDIRYSLDGINVKTFNNEELVITTGYLEKGKIENINIRLWMNEKSINTNHFHGKIIYEKIED